MNCYACGKAAVRAKVTATYRRGHREISFDTECWKCPDDCPGPDGEVPFEFYSAQDLKENDDRAREIWLVGYGEPMPGRPKPKEKGESPP